MAHPAGSWLTVVTSAGCSSAAAMSSLRAAAMMALSATAAAVSNDSYTRFDALLCHESLSVSLCPVFL